MMCTRKIERWIFGVFAVLPFVVLLICSVFVPFGLVKFDAVSSEPTVSGNYSLELPFDAYVRFSNNQAYFIIDTNDYPGIYSVMNFSSYTDGNGFPGHFEFFNGDEKLIDISSPDVYFTSYVWDRYNDDTGFYDTDYGWMIQGSYGGSFIAPAACDKVVISLPPLDNITSFSNLDRTFTMYYLLAYFNSLGYNVDVPHIVMEERSDTVSALVANIFRSSVPDFLCEPVSNAFNSLGFSDFFGVSVAWLIQVFMVQVIIDLLLCLPRMVAYFVALFTNKDAKDDFV